MHRYRDEGSCYSNQDGCCKTSNEGVFNLPRLSSSFYIPDHLASPSMQNCQSELISPLAASSPSSGNSSTSISVAETSESVLGFHCGAISLSTSIARTPSAKSWPPTIRTAMRCTPARQRPPDRPLPSPHPSNIPRPPVAAA